MVTRLTNPAVVEVLDPWKMPPTMRLANPLRGKNRTRFTAPPTGVTGVFVRVGVRVGPGGVFVRVGVDVDVRVRVTVEVRVGVLVGPGGVLVAVEVRVGVEVKVLVGRGVPPPGSLPQ